MNCLLTLLLLTKISGENIKSVTIKESGPEFRYPGPRISVVIDSVSEVDFSDDEGYVAELKDGDLTVKVDGKRGLEIEGARYCGKD